MSRPQMAEASLTMSKVTVICLNHESKEPCGAVFITIFTLWSQPQLLLLFFYFFFCVLWLAVPHHSYAEICSVNESVPLCCTNKITWCLQNHKAS